MINSAGTPFSCPHCQEELCVPSYYWRSILTASILLAALLSTVVGLKWFTWFFAVLILWIPINLLGLIIVKRYLSPPLERHVPDPPTLIPGDRR